MALEVIDTEFVIHGAGPVGLILALALAQQGRQVVLIERLPGLNERSPSQKNDSSFDGRVLALTLGSKRFLESLGVGSALAPFTTSIQHVHVSQKGYLGLTHLHAEELQVPELGVSIQASDLGQVLWQAVEQTPLIQLIQPAELQGLQQLESGIILQINNLDSGVLSELSCRFLIGADGTQSKVRKLLGLPLEQKDYHAFGVIAKIETELPHQNWSYERFTEEGPVALLPLNTHEHKAVYVCPEQKVKEVMAWDDATFIRQFAAKMGERLGAYVTVSNRVAYPLKETYAPEMRKGRAILMGNASHTQHPVAAQGLNLGIRDIEAFIASFSGLQDLAEEGLWQTALDQFVASRAADHQNTMGLTDGLIQLFQTKSPLVGHLRGLGLMALENMPSLKKRFGRKTMGLS